MFVDFSPLSPPNPPTIALLLYWYSPLYTLLFSKIRRNDGLGGLGGLNVYFQWVTTQEVYGIKRINIGILYIHSISDFTPIYQWNNHIKSDKKGSGLAVSISFDWQ